MATGVVIFITSFVGVVCHTSQFILVVALFGDTGVSAIVTLVFAAHISAFDFLNGCSGFFLAFIFFMKLTHRAVFDIALFIADTFLADAIAGITAVVAGVSFLATVKFSIKPFVSAAAGNHIALGCFILSAGTPWHCIFALFLRVIEAFFGKAGVNAIVAEFITAVVVTFNFGYIVTFARFALAGGYLIGIALLDTVFIFGIAKVGGFAAFVAFVYSVAGFQAIVKAARGIANGSVTFGETVFGADFGGVFLGTFCFFREVGGVVAGIGAGVALFGAGEVFGRRGFNGSAFNHFAD